MTFIQGCTPSGKEIQPDPIDPTGGGQGSSLITLTGKLTYDSVPITSSGLNYSGIIKKPLRKIVIQLVNASTDEIVSTSTTDNTGSYTFSYSNAISKVYLRIRAEINSPGVVIEDNTNGDAVYVVESIDYSISQNTILPNINLPSGWSSSTSSYSSNRTSAPFAILDVVLTAIEKVSAAKPSLVFPALKINWSVNNTSESGSKSAGKIGTSHYSPSEGELYILGKANVDTDEFDTHVIAHEWGHYFEDKLGRSDSIGGQHGSGDIKDSTIAFGEGWGNALSAMVLDPFIIYRDSMGQSQATIGVSFSLETSTDSSPGWFSEFSVQEILFDLYDSNNTSPDNISMGLSPLIDVMTTTQVTTRAQTSIFSFISGLKSKYSTSSTEINAITTSKSISTIIDEYGTGEKNSGGWLENLPIYRELSPGEAPTTVSFWGDGLIFNDLGNNRLFKFTAAGVTTSLHLNCADTYFIDVFDGKTTIYSGGNVFSGSALTLNQSYSTTPGKIYIIRLQTHGPFVTTSDIFNCSIDID